MDAAVPRVCRVDVPALVHRDAPRITKLPVLAAKTPPRFRERPVRGELFDAVVVFKPLDKENLLDIAELLLQKLKKNLGEKNIDFIITPSLKEKIVELGYNPTFGAREMKRVIQDKVEDVLAQAILAEEVRRGDKVEINSETFKIKK